MHYWQWPLLVHRWLYSEDWQHGLAIPLFGAYMVYSRRHDLLRAPQRGCFWGLLVMAAAALMELAGFAWLHVNYVSNVGMVLMLLGLVLYCGGPSLARVVWVPIAFWVIAMPLPPQLYQDICVKLQNIAAAGSADLMGIFGVHVEVAASTLIFNDIRGFPVQPPLEVEGACSGIHSIMAYLALGVVMAYLEDRPLWQRLSLLSVIIPVAIFTNILRVAITITAYYVDHPELGRDFMHSLTGLAMLIPTALILWGFSWLLKRLFIDADEPGSCGRGQDRMKFRGLDLQRRFVVAAGFLGAFGLFWPLAVWALDWTMTKIPVAWPNGVTVSPDFRLTSLPASFGHYRLAEGDLPGGLHLEHGERVMDEDERKILEVGTYIDAGRRLAEQQLVRQSLLRGHSPEQGLPPAILVPARGLLHGHLRDRASYPGKVHDSRRRHPGRGRSHDAVSGHRPRPAVEGPPQRPAVLLQVAGARGPGGAVLHVPGQWP